MSGAVDETVVEYGFEFDDGEVWDGFDSAFDVISYVKQSRGASDPENNYAGHAVQRTRRLTITEWSHVTPLPEPTHPLICRLERTANDTPRDPPGRTEGNQVHPRLP